MEEAQITPTEPEQFLGTMPIAPALQVLLRRWIKERDALENQINGVLQSLVLGKPGIWDLDEHATCMIKRTGAE